MEEISLIERVLDDEFTDPPKLLKNTLMNRIKLSLKHSGPIAPYRYLVYRPKLNQYDPDTHTLLHIENGDAGDRYGRLHELGRAYFFSDYPGFYSNHKQILDGFRRKYVLGKIELEHFEIMMALRSIEEGLAHHIAIESENLLIEEGEDQLGHSDVERMLMSGVTPGGIYDYVDDLDVEDKIRLVNSTDKILFFLMSSYGGTIISRFESYGKDMEMIYSLPHSLGYHYVKAFMEQEGFSLKEAMDIIIIEPPTYQTLKETIVRET